MSRVVLALSSAVDAGRAPAEAVRRAAEAGVELIALYVIDDASVGDIDRALSNRGFIGERPCADIVQAAVGEWTRCGEETLAEVKAACNEAGVACRTRLERGKVTDITLEVLRATEATVCVVPARPKSRLGRLFRRSVTGTLTPPTGVELVTVCLEPGG